MVKWGRLFTAMVTPFNEKLEVDYKRAGDLARKLVKEGSDGIVVTGTTGESPALSDGEKLKLYSTVKEAVGKDITVIAGTGSNATMHSAELTKEAEKTGVDGAMLVGPYYNKPTQKGYIEHFKTIAESTSLPVIIYNVPGRTGGNIQAETLVEISKIDNVVAIKEASGDIGQIGEVINKTSPDIMVFSGDDGITFPVMCLGGHGVISVASHLVGLKIKEMVEAISSGDLKKARELHYYLMPAFKGIFVVTNPIPVKMALNLSGFPAGGFRLPLVEGDETVVEKLKSLLECYGLKGR